MDEIADADLTLDPLVDMWVTSAERVLAQRGDDHETTLAGQIAAWTRPERIAELVSLTCTACGTEYWRPAIPPTFGGVYGSARVAGWRIGPGGRIRVCSACAGGGPAERDRLRDEREASDELDTLEGERWRQGTSRAQ